MYIYNSPASIRAATSRVAHKSYKTMKQAILDKACHSLLEVSPWMLSLTLSGADVESVVVHVVSNPSHAAAWSMI